MSFPHLPGRAALVIALALGAGGLRAQGGATTTTLEEAPEPGVVVERQLAAGAAHLYRLALAPGEFLRVEVEQIGIDLTVRLLGPGGTPVARIDESPAAETEDLCAVVEAGGEHRLEVAPFRDGAGAYRLRIVALRPPTEEDRTRARAAGLVQEALTLMGAENALAAAVAKFDEAVPLWSELGDAGNEAQARFRAARARLELREADRAIEELERARALWRELGDREGQAKAANALGRAERGRNRPEAAIAWLEEALAINRELGNHDSQAINLSNLGMVYAQIGELHDALERQLEALELARQAGDTQAEARTLVNLGSVHHDLGDVQEALLSYEWALALLAPDDRSTRASVLNNLGATYQVLGEWDKALENFGQALELNRALGNRRREAVTLNNLGVIHQRLRDTARAAEHFERAAALAGEGGDPSTEASAHNNLGQLALESGQSERALAASGRALELARAAGRRDTEAAALRTLGVARGNLGDLDAAGESIERALAIERARGDRVGEAASLLALARVERARQRLGDARLLARAAVELVESLRRSVLHDELRTSFLAAKQPYYEELIEILVDLHGAHPGEGFAVEALEVSERARARSLLDILSDSGGDLLAGAEPALLERERRLRREINARELHRMRVAGGEQRPEQLADAERKLEAARTEYQRLETELKRSSPRYASLTQPEPASLDEIRRQLGGDDTLLLEYALGERRSFLWAVTASSITEVELPGRAVVEEAARQVYELATARNARLAGETPAGRRERIARADAAWLEAAGRLSSIVLGPVAPLLGERRLVVVADGALHYVPFGALPLPGTGELAITRHEVVSLPSASVLAVLRREVASRPAAAKTLAVFADPVFQREDVRMARAMTGGSGGVERVATSEPPLRGGKGEHDPEGFPRLRFSEKEALAIAALVPSNRRLTALGFAASRATAASADLASYRLVHFATHGLLNSRHPELSSLVLSLWDERGTPQDGFLRLHDVYNLRLAADLVVLSACRTALGKEVRGEGLVGLTRGFMYAGAARVLASLWSVDDRATAELMERFYRGMLVEGLTPAAALRAAQLSLAAEPHREPPYYWAGFSLQGEWR